MRGGRGGPEQAWLSINSGSEASASTSHRQGVVPQQLDVWVSYGHFGPSLCSSALCRCSEGPEGGLLPWTSGSFLVSTDEPLHVKPARA
jgi:hypothetical protein